MKLYFYDKNKIINFVLPNKKIGNFWLADEENKNVININGEDNKWVVTGNKNINVLGNAENGKVVLKEKTYFVISKDAEKKLLFADSSSDETFDGYVVTEGIPFKLGKGATCDIVVRNPYILDEHIEFNFENNRWTIKRLNNSIVYIDNHIMKEETKVVKNGISVDIYGIKIVLIYGKLFINNPNHDLTFNAKLNKCSFVEHEEIGEEEIDNINMYNDSDYFLRSPRMRRSIQTLEIGIDSPPTKEEVPETPLILTIGPMLTMGASSAITIANTFQTVNDGTKTFKQVWPTLFISVCMLVSMLVWPFLTKKFEEKRRKKKEDERNQKYRAYIDKKREEIVREYESQKKTYEENLLPLNACYDIITNKRRTLWERKIDQNDFLTIRLGVGNVPFDAKINYHTEDFRMDDDELKSLVEGLIKGYKEIQNVPLGFSLAANRLTALCGMYPKYIKFMDNVFLQLMAYHSYDNLKFVIFTNKDNQERWSYIKETPYCFSDDKSIRFFATTIEEMQEVSNYLDKVFAGREALFNTSGSDRPDDYSKFKTYYLILTDDIDVSRKINIINSVLKGKINFGFSLITIEEKLSKIPSEVSNFLTIGDNVSAVISTIDNEQVKFKDEIVDTFDMEACTKVVSNLPLYLTENAKELPNTITFLEMFGVGQIEQLNVLNRWAGNDPTKSLRTEIGANENNDVFILDLHEKQHGPHGLVAGMTGSGKSEFIITFVLSMAVNYSPEEVAFVLIDYKGGGLAGAFENNELGKKLPHVVGTITNLDKSEINRALSSIQSELRRRQERFNEVKEQTGESTIDIYKYQKLYRDGVINEPMPHLIIVSDEFAELKEQQPDFMDDLVSTARIGRSLGVHLILATQKPSGVVDAQIWSNSKFKICLKVQDKSDSMEMIKTDLAAELKQTGRFYLQVGYNEYFAMGQAAWAGAQYYPSKEYKKAADKNLYFIDNTGFVNKTIKNSIAKKFVKSEGEELTNIVKYLINIGNDANLKIRPLWLDKIPAKILLSNLTKKYPYEKTDYVLNPVIGEYDDPANQSQGLLTLPISEQGNVIVYGTGDSGKDEFASSFIYSCITTYTTNELNLYIMDFGAETLQNYREAPQVGDVMINGDDEKIENIAKMLNSEMNKRKKLFMAYNGNYQDYIKLSGQTLPNIVVVINSIEVLTEVYQEYTEKIIGPVREGSKYGIYFVILTTSQSTVKFKVSQSCKLALCLQMNGANDYRDILGKTEGLVPSAILGRGLIRIGEVCEFQTASITEEDSSYNVIKETVDGLKAKNLPKAKPVPVMPETIKIDLFRTKYLGLDTVPIGLTRDSLNAQLYDFKKETFNIISSNELETMKPFIKNLIAILERNNTFNKIIVDVSNFFEDLQTTIPYESTDFNKVVDSLKEYNTKVQEVLNQNNMNPRSVKDMPNNVCMVIGIEKFFNKLDEDHKTAFKEILSTNKEVAKTNFIFVDVPGAFKKFEYDDWYKASANTNDGIWIGGGVTQQFLIKLTLQLTSFSNIENNFGVYVKNGMPTIIKMINEIK